VLRPAGYSPHAYRHESHDRGSWWLAALSLLNFGAVIAIGGLLIFQSEDWWLSVPLVYVPKAPLAAPSCLFLLWGLATRRKWAMVNAASLALVLGPIMGFAAPIDRWMQEPPPRFPDDLRVVSCNIQGFQPSFPLVVAEVLSHSPDIVAFQEVRGEEDHPLLAKAFGDWHVARDDYYWVASKYPLRKIRLLESPAFGRNAGLLVEVESPTGPVLVADIHFMTARRSLAELSLGGFLNDENRAIIEEHQSLREREMMDVRAQIDDERAARPLILLGDFNTPTSSSLFRRWWSDFQSAFDVAGWGYGYTSPCRQHAHWFQNTPWVRIDHVLCSDDWQVIDCDIGRQDGSDHRLIAARLRARPKLVPSAAAPPGSAGRAGFPESVDSDARDD
jgi:endonuclease/exonuclease/phosphatase family metal-dependent hydrolase